MGKFVESLTSDAVLYVVRGKKKNGNIIAINLDSKKLSLKKIPLYSIADKKPKPRNIFFSLHEKSFYKNKKRTMKRYHEIKKEVDVLNLRVHN